MSEYNEVRAEQPDAADHRPVHSVPKAGAPLAARGGADQNPVMQSPGLRDRFESKGLH